MRFLFSSFQVFLNVVFYICIPGIECVFSTSILERLLNVIRGELKDIDVLSKRHLEEAKLELAVV